jgi:two-component system response regulator PilR (NtrC family)
MTQNAPHILVVDDELSMRELLEYMLAKENYKVTCAESGKEAIARLEKDHFDLLLCDIRLGDITGLDVLRACKEHHPDNAVILISAYATTETAVEAMNEGAFDYVPKPFDKDELMATIAKALELRSIEHEKKQLDDELKKNLHFGMIVGNSPAMRHIYKLIEQVAKTKTNILITGESGTGKEVKAIHQESDRSDQPFMVINCGGIPETLMESELFGHKKGSFTGATNDKKGLFEIAHKGTVFLDEIGELSLRSRKRYLCLWGATKIFRLIFGLLQPPIKVLKRKSSTEILERICSIVSM